MLSSFSVKLFEQSMPVVHALQVPLYPEKAIQASAVPQEPLSWKGDLLAIGIYSDSLNVKGHPPARPCMTLQPLHAVLVLLCGIQYRNAFSMHAVCVQPSFSIGKHWT